MFSWSQYLFLSIDTKKTKPQIDAFIAKEKEKDLIKDKRRATKRRKWALAIGDIVARRNGLSVNGFTLDLKLTDDKRQQLALQVKQELGTETYQSNEDLPSTNWRYITALGYRAW